MYCCITRATCLCGDSVYCSCIHVYPHYTSTIILIWQPGCWDSRSQSVLVLWQYVFFIQL